MSTSCGREGKGRLILLANEAQGVQVKLCHPLSLPAVPERLGDVSCIGAGQIRITVIYTGAVLVATTTTCAVCWRRCFRRTDTARECCDGIVSAAGARLVPASSTWRDTASVCRASPAS